MLCLFVASAVAPTAVAQPPDAASLDKRARKAYREGRYSAAIALWQRAFTADGSYFESLFNVALAHEKQHQLKAAVRAYRRYVSLSPNKAPRREAAQQAIKRLSVALAGERGEERLGKIERFNKRVRLVIQTTIEVELANAVEGARVSKARARRIQRRLARQLVDQYQASVTAAFARELTINNLDRSAEVARKVIGRLRKRVRGAVLGATLAPVKAKKPPPKRLPPNPNAGFGVRVAGYVLGGAGVLLLGLGSAGGLKARRLNDELTNATGSWSMAMFDKIQRGHDADDNAKVLWLAGGATLAVGAVVWAIGWKIGANASAAHRRYVEERSVSITPVVTPRGASVAVRGQF